MAERQSLSVGVRLGALEDVEREEGRDLGLRVFIGKRQAVVSASDFSAATRERLIERAVASAGQKLAPDEPLCRTSRQEDLLERGPHPRRSSSALGRVRRRERWRRAPARRKTSPALWRA